MWNWSDQIFTCPVQSICGISGCVDLLKYFGIITCFTCDCNLNCFANSWQSACWEVESKLWGSSKMDCESYSKLKTRCQDWCKVGNCYHGTHPAQRVRLKYTAVFLCNFHLTILSRSAFFHLIFSCLTLFVLRYEQLIDHAKGLSGRTYKLVSQLLEHAQAQAAR